MMRDTGYDETHCYLGPADWPQWVLRLAPFWEVFNFCAYLHDLFFAKGGNLADFERANRIFRSMCLANAKTPWQRNFALFYAWCVDTFGHLFFAWHETLKKRACR